MMFSGLMGEDNGKSSPATPLSLGIILDSPALPAWMHHALGGVLKSGCAEVRLLIFASAKRRASFFGAEPYEATVLSSTDSWSWSMNSY